MQKPRFFQLQNTLLNTDKLRQIVISAVQGSVIHNSDFTHITCYECTDLRVSGKVDIPNQMFSMPLKRDDGRLILFPVEVIDGTFEAVLNFPTSGQYIYTEEQANHDLPVPVFSVDPIKIDVLRKTT